MHLIAGSLESANSSILAARRLFKDFGGEKNQDFMIIRCPITLPVTSLTGQQGNVTTSFLFSLVARIQTGYEILTSLFYITFVVRS